MPCQVLAGTRKVATLARPLKMNLLIMVPCSLSVRWTFHLVNTLPEGAHQVGGTPNNLSRGVPLST